MVSYKDNPRGHIALPIQSALIAALFLFAAGSVHAAPNSITARLSADRTSGKAPLLVIFDATQSTDSDTNKPIHHLTYSFNCGDGSTSEYTLAGHKRTRKCIFTGSPYFAHVYETPGTYTAVVTATSTDGDSSTRSVTINVAGWSAADTTCVSASGNFNGCPSGANRVTDSDFDAHGDDDLRVLYRCGENFAASGAVEVVNGQYIGAFDNGGPVTDRRCRYNVSGVPVPLFNVTGDDVRVRDGNWSGTKNGAFMNAHAATWDDVNHLLIQNWNVTTTGTLLTLAGNGQGGTALPSSIGVFEVDARNCGKVSCIFSAAQKVAVVGSSLGGSDGHVLRFQHAEGCFVHNSKFDNAPGGHLITVRGLAWDGAIGDIPNRWSENCFLSDNFFESDNAWPVQLGQDNGSGGAPPQHRNLILERNYWTWDSVINAAQGINIQKRSPAHQHFTIRNNIFNFNGTGNGTAAIGGTVPTTEVYGNSLFQPNGSSARFWRFPGGGDCIARNNVSWNAGGAINTFDEGSCGNSSNNADSNGGEPGVGRLTQCPFAACPPQSVADFQIKASDPDGLSDGGAFVANLVDFNQVPRPQGSGPGIGAFEPLSGGPIALQPPSNLRVLSVTP